MVDPRGLVGKILPPPGLPRQLVVQSSLVAIGWGVYLTGSVVFFNQYVGLSAVKIGLGFSIAGFVSLVAALPLGHLADRIGGKRAWVLGALVGASAFAAYPLVQGFWSFVLVLGLETLAVTLTDAGRSVYQAAAVPREIRMRTMGFIRAYLNAGFTLGAGVGAAAIALDSRPGLLILVLVNAAGLSLNAFVVSRMPSPPVAPPTPVATPKPRPLGVLRDHPYTAVAVIFAAMFMSETLFMTIVPLWVITSTDVPKPVLGGLFALNTVMAVLLQVAATRGADTMAGSARLTWMAALATAAACPVFALSGMTSGWVTILVLAVGVVLLTGTELWSSATQWYFTTDVPPEGQRGVYLGIMNTFRGLSKVVGPASLTFLTVRTGGWGWWVIAGFFGLCALAVRPVIAWVARTPRNGASVPAGS